jgi:cholesterol transport system auxiliary component
MNGLSTMLACAAIALAGCLGPRTTPPDKRFYAFDVGSLETTRTEPIDASLAVHRVRVTPRYEGQSFVYRRGEYEFESDYYPQFLIPPAAMLGEEVRRALAGAQLFRAVVGPSSSVDADFGLEVVVNDLYADWRAGEVPRAVIEVDLFLLDETGGDRAIELHRTYRREVELDERSHEELVAGWSSALRDALAQWAFELARKLEGRADARAVPSAD